MKQGMGAAMLVFLLAGMGYAADYGISLSASPSDARVGDDIVIVASINNTGIQPARQVRAVLGSSGPGLELMHIEESLGTIEPGENKTAVFTAKVLNQSSTEITIRILSPGTETKKYIYTYPLAGKKEPAGVNGSLLRMVEAEERLNDAREKRAANCTEGEAQMKAGEEYYSASQGNWTEYKAGGDGALLANVLENAENAISYTEQAAAEFRKCAGKAKPLLERIKQIEYVLDFMDRTGKKYNESARERIDRVKNDPSDAMVQEELDKVTEEIKEPAVGAMLEEIVRISKKTNKFEREFAVLKDNWGIDELQRNETAENIASAKKHLATASENIDNGEKFLRKSNVAISGIYSADEAITMATETFDSATRTAYIKLLAAGTVLAAAIIGLIVLMYAEYRKYLERKRKLVDTPEGLYYKKQRIGGR